MSLFDRLNEALAASQDDHATGVDEAHIQPDGGIHIPAAVLVAITDRPDPGVILTQRPDYLRSHPGQIAFPGGKIDPDDADAVAAALREADEELGLAPHHVRVIGPTGIYRSGSGFAITPVLAVMTLGVDTQSAKQSNLNGISMHADPESYMNLFRSMKTRRIGVILNPARSGWYLKQARQAAQKAGIELVVREISATSEVTAKLASLADKVDALWMLPDMTAVTRDTTESYFRFGQENSVPVISFAGSYVGLGAAAALDIDRFALGRQADRLSIELLSDRKSGLQVVFPDKTVLKRNSNVLQRLHIEPETLGRIAD